MAACHTDGDSVVGRVASSLSVDGHPPELLYRREAVVDRDGAVLESATVGELTADLRSRAARPWSHPGEPAVLTNTFDIPDGENRRRVYELLAGEVVPPPPEPGETVVDPRLMARLESASPTELLPVAFFLRDWPAWDVPLPPEPGALTEEEEAVVREARTAAIEARKALVVTRSAALSAAVVDAGGSIENLGWGAGWVTVLVPARGVADLVGRDDVRRTALEDAVPRDASLPLGDVGAPAMTSASLYQSNNYTGERSSGRNTFGDITIATAETGGMEDEAKFLCDTGTGCPGDSRLRKRVSCLNPDTSNLGTCDEESNIPEASEGNHGTWVASIALGDYTDGQCDGFYCGDSTTSHTTTWKQQASGVAREASLVYFRGLAGGVGNLAEVFTDSVDDGVDVVSLSLEPDQACRVKTTTTAEAELETAYADGIFVASCSGNNADSSGACTVTSPSGIPAAFTVGSFADAGGMLVTGCDAYDQDCRFASLHSRHGGGDTLDASGASLAESQSMVDLLGPTLMTRVTNAENTYGEATSSPGGCSFATPYVAGAAALTKDFFLAKGDTWINSPGRLHTVMLAMADRAEAGTGGVPTQHATTPDRTYGFGRLKLRAFHAWGGLEPHGYQQITASMTPTSPTYFATLNGGQPLPLGTELVKCVLHQTEMMDAKDRVSNVNLRVLTWAPSGSSCGSPSLAAYVTDTAPDTQALVAVAASLAGKCARVELIPGGIHWSGVTAHAFCYFAGENDDAPN